MTPTLQGTLAKLDAKAMRNAIEDLKRARTALEVALIYFGESQGKEFAMSMDEASAQVEVTLPNFKLVEAIDSTDIKNNSRTTVQAAPA